MSDTPDLHGATAYRETARPESTERWHVLADGVTVIYERRPGEFEPARVLTAETLARRDAWTVVVER
jgi:hypothetical protein